MVLVAAVKVGVLIEFALFISGLQKPPFLSKTMSFSQELEQLSS
jgi:archaellin